MPTPRLSDEDALEAWDAFVEYGSLDRAATALGMNYNKFRKRYHIARNRGLHLSAGAKAAVAQAGLNGVEAKGGWIHNYDDEGKKVGTTRWSAPSEEATEDFLARLRTAFDGIRPARALAVPEHVAEDVCNVFPLFDVHWGMHAWGVETGGPDYDLKLAAGDMKLAFENVLQLTPAGDEAVLILGGDFYHIDDNTNETPGHAHKLDADGRYPKVLDTSIEVMAYVIDRIRERHRKTTIRVLRGNHDENSCHALRVGLAQRYRRVDNVVVDGGIRDLFMFQWGRTGIFAHHGDKMNANDFTHKLADVCPFWSASPHRYAYTGHKHKLGAERIGGLNWERLEPFCPADAYGASWVNRRALKADTYRKDKGRVGSAYDPIERAVA